MSSTLLEETLLRRADVLALLGGMPNGTFASIEHRGQGPAFIRLGGRLKMYRKADVLAWLESRRVVPGGDR